VWYVLSFSVPRPVMPGYCCVPMCKSAIGGHHFPSDQTLRQRWIVAIDRVDSSSQHKLWTPSRHSVVCHKHFKESDYRETLLGWTVILQYYSTACHLLFFPRCREWQRWLATRKVSVCPSVCQTRGLWQNRRNICPNFYIIWKTMQPSFLRRMVGGSDPGGGSHST